MTKSISYQAYERITALVSLTGRQTDQIKELTEQRDRARGTAVALEQQLAKLEDELRSLETHYETEYYRTGDPTDEAGLSAVQDCVTSIDVITDVVANDSCADMFGGAA